MTMTATSYSDLAAPEADPGRAVAEVRRLGDRLKRGSPMLIRPWRGCSPTAPPAEARLQPGGSPAATRLQPVASPAADRAAPVSRLAGSMRRYDNAADL
jgi:hypothetical protein